MLAKQLVSAILTEALHANYWKPIQSGVVEGKDSDTVKSLITNDTSVFYPETYLLNEPLSPHFAAKIDGIEIELQKIHAQFLSDINSQKSSITSVESHNHLIIEGAGGLLVPINKTQYVIDIAKQFDCEIVLVISSYLGCINHSLLSIDYLVKNNFKLKALVFNGEFEYEVKQAILDYVSDLLVLDVPQLNQLSKDSVLQISSQIKSQIAL